jgi:3',5'-cyclic AMP phosphodiesterase CpdA
MKYSKYVPVALFLFSFQIGLAQQDPQLRDPERIFLNLTDRPSTSIAITWRTAAPSANPCVEYAEATDGIQFLKLTRKHPSKREEFETDKKKRVFQYSAVVDGLKQSTTYVYRVGADSVWSEWNQFSTGADNAVPFSFVWMGDPQDDIKEHVSRSFRQAYKIAPEAKFWMFSGDMASEPEDDLFGELFYAAGFAFRSTPMMMVPGNHDMGYRIEDGKIVLDARGRKQRGKTVSTLWKASFTLPGNGVQGLEETSYVIDYQGVRFFMLNSSAGLPEQAAWMEKHLADNPNKWTIAAFHHPLYSTGRERDERSTRDAFLPVLDKYRVDLVLTGHDHTYARSFGLRNGAVAKDGDPGTVYVVSSCGPKTYVLNPRYKDLMAKMGEGLQLFHLISVDGKKLSFKTFTVTGSLFDTFEIKK